MVRLLTLPGPVFLQIFISLSILTFLGLNWLSAVLEPEPQSFAQVRDPYLIAYLRGELDELIRVAILTLTLRGLLKVDSQGIQTVDAAEIKRAQVPIEKVTLTACLQRATPALIEANSRVRAVGRDYQRQLIERGLVNSEASLQRRWRCMGRVGRVGAIGDRQDRRGLEYRTSQHRVPGDGPDRRLFHSAEPG